jgi:hypothetical protein
MSTLRLIVEGYLAAALVVCAGALYFATLAQAKHRARRPMALQEYRPVYLPSGRRNRVRY